MVSGKAKGSISGNLKGEKVTCQTVTTGQSIRELRKDPGLGEEEVNGGLDNSSFGRVLSRC